MGFFDTTPSACFIDDLLNFNIDGTEALNDTNFHEAAVISQSPAVFASPECEDEEELEWLSNKDVFPSVDTFVPCVETLDDMMSLESSTTATTLKHESPVSVLENGTSSFRSNNWKNSNAVITSCCNGRGLVSVRRPRSKRYRRRLRGGFVNVPSQQWFVLCGRIEPNKSMNNNAVRGSESGVAIGKKCKHCGSEKTPQWRAGPDGPKTLCNACGVRYKSGRLFPEYRPANSPTFSNAVHSSSHKKIIEMRKMKLVHNMMVNSVGSG